MQTDQPAEVGLLQRIRDTFASPTRLAHRIRDRTPWLDVLLISTAVALLSVALMPDEVFVEPMREAVTRRGEPVQITSDPDVVARWGRGMGMLGTIATHPIIAFTVAGVLTLLFSIVGRGQTTVREYLSLSTHAMLIPAFGTLLAIAIRLLTGIGTGSLGLAAIYSPDDASNFLTAAAASLDPFIIWMLVVIGIGIHAMDPRLSNARTTAILVGGYLLLILGSTALLHPELRASGSEQPPERLS